MNTDDLKAGSKIAFGTLTKGGGYGLVLSWERDDKRILLIRNSAGTPEIDLVHSPPQDSRVIDDLLTPLWIQAAFNLYLKGVEDGKAQKAGRTRGKAAA